MHRLNMVLFPSTSFETFDFLGFGTNIKPLENLVPKKIKSKIDFKEVFCVST